MEPRIVTVTYDRAQQTFVTKDPECPLLDTSEEAHAVAMEMLIPVFSTRNTTDPIYINVEEDTIFLDTGRFGDPGRVLLDWYENLAIEEFRKVERLDIGIYSDRLDLTTNCAETFGNTFLLDQAKKGLRLTQVRLVMHRSSGCAKDSHGGQIQMVRLSDKCRVKCGDRRFDAIMKVNTEILDVARGYWGSEHNETYMEGVEGPLKLETHQKFCTLHDVEG